MNILVISPITTHPTTAGNRIRILRLCEELESLGHSVEFLLLRGRDEEFDAALEYWGSRFHRITGEKRSYLELLHSLRFLIEKFVFNTKDGILEFLGVEGHDHVDSKYYLESTRLIKKVVAQTKADAVVVEYIWASRCLPSLPNHLLKIIDTHDVFGYRNKMFEGLDDPGWFSTTPRRERNALKRADCVFAITDSEKRIFESYGISPVFTVGHTVTTQPWDNAINQEEHEYHIGFLGSFNGPNEIGWNWFLKEVLPIIWNLLPDVRIGVAGDICLYHR